MLDEYTVETIDYTDTERVRVVYDTDPTNPITDTDMGLSFYRLSVGRNYDAIESGKLAHHDTLATIEEWADDDDAAETAMLKHFERAKIPADVIELTAERDFVGRYLVYQDETDGNYLEGSIKTLQQYYDGEVYGILHEVRESYVNTEDPNDTHSHWNCIDSVWGFIGYEYALTEAAAYFTPVTATGATA